jgi:hypothetical protein
VKLSNEKGSNAKTEDTPTMHFLSFLKGALPAASEMGIIAHIETMFLFFVPMQHLSDTS